ncbi:MAG: hypothetical protein AB7Q29_05215 [Vicinamibacterales bacterium]
MVRVGARSLSQLIGAVAVTAVAWIAGAGTSAASDRYALVVTGASGGPQYAEKYDAWRSAVVQTLQGSLRLAERNVLVLAEDEGAGTEKVTRDNVKAALATLRQRAKKDDVVFVLLMGHGSGTEADEAKFNLIGPDLSAQEWADLFAPLKARLVFVNAASGSFPFLSALSARNRIVISANDTAAQQYETVLPEFFLAALRDTNADLDKNGRVSVWEAFVHASAGVKNWYEQRGQLPTERPVLDDDGDGVGQQSDEVGTDGILAKVTYIAADEPIDETADAEMNALLRRRVELNREIEELRARKPLMDPEEYERELEKLLLDLARVDRDLRSKS